MIVRAIIVLVVVGAVAAGGLLLLSGGDPPPRYSIIFDNAFGLTDDADIKVAGVRVGSVAGLDVQPRTARAIVTAEISRPDFGDLRKDVFCKIEPQSLIGEYFVNCDAGTSPQRLPEGATIPVEQTATTVPPDLVNNIMRRPFRERLGILLSEFGAGFAARGPELQATIKRAIPALRETDRVLRILSNNRSTIEALTRESDQVLVRLAANRDDVSRFVSEARDTAAASADRRVDLATDIRLLPPFLRRLRPALRDLGTAADRQTPALRNLRLAADDLELLLDRLGPFARASVPAVRSLGKASDTGRQAMRVAGRTVARVRRLSQVGREPVRNLRFILEHLDDRRFAVEPNQQSPGGQGFTGLEALLQYPFVQSQAINIFDDRGYILKLNILPTECSAYREKESVRRNPELRRKCSAALGPSAPGIDDDTGSTSASGGRTGSGGGRARALPGAPRPSSAPAPPGASSPPATSARSSDAAPADARTQAGLLDFLMGP